MINKPDWHAAAQTLVNSFYALEKPEDRIRLTEKLCDRLGGNLYPAFLQILLNVEQYADEDAKALVTSTLVFGLHTGRLPSGKLSAWGSSAPPEANAFGQTRSLGPIEYICAWYAQPSDQSALDRAAFSTMATSLLRLAESDQAAKSLYCAKLTEDAQDPLSGSMSRQTRTAIGALATAWSNGESPDKSVQNFVDALSTSSSLLDDISVSRPPDSSNF